MQKTKQAFYNKYLNFVYNGFLKKAPVQVTLFVTSRCNIRCKMCFYWEPVENKSTHEISLDEIEKISKSMPNFFWLLVGGGEIFVRKDLPEIIKIFYKNNNIKHVSIPTNATYEDKIISSLERILSECPDLFLNLNLSLNGLGKDHDELCQSDGVFNKFLSTYERLKNLKKKFSNLGIGLNVTHSKFSEDKLNDIVDYTVKNLKEIDNISLGLVRGRPKDSSAINVNIDKYKETVQKIESYAVQGKIRTFNTFLGKIAFIKDMIMRRVIANTVKSGFQIPCLAGKVSLVIDEKTNVYPCEMLSSVGNLRDLNYDMKKILDGQKLREAVTKIKNNNCYCTHECSYSTNILFNIPLMLTIFKTYLVFLIKNLFNSEEIFKNFEDLKYFRSKQNKQFYGQKGNLYSGQTFGVLKKNEKSHDPTVPF